jgi:hypothetical protein
VSATYTPAGSGIDPFDITGTPRSVEYDKELDNHIYSDFMMFTVMHSVLSAGGITEPTLNVESQKGDTLTIADPEGDDATWRIVSRNYNYVTGEWALGLTLDKVRIVE